MLLKNVYVLLIFDMCEPEIHFKMPRKPSCKISNCVQSSRKRDKKERSQVCLTSPSSDSSQETLDVKANQVCIQGSRPTRGAKLKGFQQISKAISKECTYDSSPERKYIHSEQLHEQFEPECCDIIDNCKTKQNKKKIKIKSKTKAGESIDEYEQRLEKRRQYELKRRANESKEKRKRYLEKQRLYALNRRANETVVEREQRLERERQLRFKHKASESIDKLEQRREKDRQYRLQCRANETAEQRKHRLDRIKQYRMKQKASNVKQCDKLEKPIECTTIHKPNESKQIDQCLVNLLQAAPKKEKEESERKGKDEITDDIEPHDVFKIKTEPSNQEYNQFCNNVALERIEDPMTSVNSDDNKLYDYFSEHGISGNNVKTENNLLDDKYEVKKVLKMELDIESEGVQKTNDSNNSMVDNNNEKNINTYNIFNFLQRSGDKCDENEFSQLSFASHSLDSHERLNENRSNQGSILESLLSKPARTPQVPNLQQLLKFVSKKEPPTRPLKNHSRLSTFEYRKYILKRKANESVEEHEQRLEKQRQYELKRKAGETVEKREQRLEKRRQYLSKAMANESFEQRERRLKRQRQYEIKRKANETAEQRQRRLARQKKYDLKRKNNESVEDRELYLKRHREIEANLRARQSKEQREKYRQRRRENRLNRLANETAEEREQRLEKRRQYLSRRRAQKSGGKNEITEDINHEFVKIKTKARDQEYNQFCDNDTSESIGDQNHSVNSDGQSTL